MKRCSLTMRTERRSLKQEMDRDGQKLGPRRRFFYSALGAGQGGPISRAYSVFSAIREESMGDPCPCLNAHFASEVDAVEHSLQRLSYVVNPVFNQCATNSWRQELDSSGEYAVSKEKGTEE
jgi:hypothetical protein